MLSHSVFQILAIFLLFWRFLLSRHPTVVYLVMNYSTSENKKIVGCPVRLLFSRSTPFFEVSGERASVIVAGGNLNAGTFKLRASRRPNLSLLTIIRFLFFAAMKRRAKVWATQPTHKCSLFLKKLLSCTFGYELFQQWEWNNRRLPSETFIQQKFESGKTRRGVRRSVHVQIQTRTLSCINQRCFFALHMRIIFLSN